MTKIFMVRHCEAIGNVKHIFQGITDLDITDLGEKQLECLTKRFEDIPLDRVYASPLTRTVKTARAIVGQKDIQLIPDRGLIEMNCGIMDGKPFSEIFGQNPELNEIWLNRPQDFAPIGGEKMTDAYERVWSTVLRLAEENRGKSIACATHGGILRCLNCRLLKNDISQLKTVPFADNTAVSLIEFDDSLNPTLVFYNDNSHVPPELRNAASRVPLKAEEMSE